MKQRSNKTRIIEILDIMIQASIVGMVGSMPVSIAFCQVSLGVGCLAWILRSLLEKRWDGFRTPFDTPLMLFLTACVIASFTSIKQIDSFISLKKFYLVAALYLTAYNTKSLERIYELSGLFVSVTALTGLYGIFMNLSSSQPRLLGTQGMAMTSGGIFMIATLLGMALATEPASFPKIKIWRWAIPAIAFASLILTKTVSSWLGFLSGVIIFFARKKRDIVLVLSTLFGISLFILVNMKCDNNQLAGKKSSTWEARLTIWRIGWQLIKERPILGTGLIDLGELYQSKRSAEDNRLHGRTRRVGHLHNNFIHITATTGVIGLLAFSYIWFVAIKFLYRLKKKIPETGNAILRAMLTIVTAFLINGMAEWNFGDSEVVTIIWFVLGMAVAMNKLFVYNAIPSLMVDNEKII